MEYSIYIERRKARVHNEDVLWNKHTRYSWQSKGLFIKTQGMQIRLLRR